MLHDQKQDWRTVFKTFHDENEAGGSSRWLVSPDTVRNFIEQVVKGEKVKVLEEIEKKINLNTGKGFITLDDLKALKSSL